MDGQALMGLGGLSVIIGLVLLLIPIEDRNRLSRFNQLSAGLIALGVILLLIGFLTEWDLLR